MISLQLEASIRDLRFDQEGVRWMLQLSMGFWDLFEGIMLFLVLSWGIPKVRHPIPAGLELQPFTEPYIGSLLAEYLRLLAQVILWGLLLLIPGFIRYCRLIFVPYIAIFSKLYREDKVDALQYSLQLTKPVFFKILGVFLATTLLMLGVEFLPHLIEALYIWPVRILLMTVGTLIGIWTYCYMFVLFEAALTAEVKDGSNV